MIAAPLIFFGAMIAVPAQPPQEVPVPGRPRQEPVPLMLRTYGLVSPYRDLEAVRDADAKLPHFDTSVDVVGHPSDPNVTMAVWWAHWKFETSIYGRGINIQPSINLIPLIEWLAKKKDNKMGKDDGS